MKKIKTQKQRKMKKQFTKALAAIVLLASGFTATANESESEISLTTEKQKAVVLQMNNIEAGTQISIVDEEGKLLFKDQAASNQYGKVFNLNQFEEGQLYLEIESAEKLEVRSIEVTETKASLSSKAELVIEKPSVRINDGTMKVYFGENESVCGMKIYDSLGDVAFKDQIGSAQMKRYDVSKLSEGSYEIQFTAKGRNFYHTISL